jgi:hypothetical protein
MQEIEIQAMLYKNTEELIKIILDGFIINYKNNNYLISVHHNLPLKKESFLVKINNSIVFTSSIQYRPLWNEILILNCNNNVKTNKTINNFRYNCKDGEKLYMKNKSIIFHKNSNRYFPLGRIDVHFPVLYYESRLIKGQVEKSFSGAEVCDSKGKIVGIFCMGNAKTEKFLILPIIYLTKMLIKKKKIDIFGIETNNIKKINRYKVNNNFIFYRQLGFNIPVSTFLMLEGDDDKQESITLNDNTEIKLKYEVFNSKLIIKNFDKIEYIDDNYIINIPLLSMLKKFNQRNLVLEIFKKIENKELFNLKLNKTTKLFEFV